MPLTADRCLHDVALLSLEVLFAKDYSEVAVRSAQLRLKPVSVVLYDDFFSPLTVSKGVLDCRHPKTKTTPRRDRRRRTGRGRVSVETDIETTMPR